MTAPVAQSIPTPAAPKLPDWLIKAISWSTAIGNTAEPNILEPGQTTTLLQDAQNLSRGLSYLSKLDLDFKAIYGGWQTEDLETKVSQGLDVEAQLLNLVSLYIPGAVLFADGVTILEIIIPLAMYAAKVFDKHEREVVQGSIPDGEGGFVPAHGWPELDRNGHFLAYPVECQK